MYTPIKKEIKRLALENPSEEICGLLYVQDKNLKIYPCKNVALDKALEFEIDPQEYIACTLLGRPCAIYHSHPAGSLAAFSVHDLETAKEWDLPFHLYCVDEDRFLEYIPPEHKINLEGIPFCWGWHDCYSLVRDFFRQSHGIYMNDYDRDETFESTDTNVIMENFEKENFHQLAGVGLIQKNDVLVFHSHRAYPQHFGIFLGSSKMLHHPLGNLSRIESITPNWQKRLQLIFRYNKPL